MVTLPAHLVATPVLERLTGELEGAVLGAGDTAAWIGLEEFVVIITTREVPLLPNAIALSARSGTLVAAAAGARGTVRLGPGQVTLGSLQITWDPAAPPSWDPTVPVPTGATPAEVAARGAALLDALGSRPAPRVEGSQRGVDNLGPPLPGSATLPVRGPRNPGLRLRRALGSQQPGVAESPALVRELARIGLGTAADPEGAAGLTLLFRAVRERDPEPAAAAVRALLGRGPGLTPEGDDLLAAVAGTVAVLGPATSPPPISPPAISAHDPAPAARHHPGPVGRHDPPQDPLLAALTPLPGRTTALAATLLALALHRRLPEPAGRLLDLSQAGEVAWPAALARLERLGHGSGRAYAAGIAATACLLAAGTPAR